MADLVYPTDVDSGVAPVQIESQFTVVAATAINAGQPCYINGTTGKATLGDASAAGTAGIRGIAVTTAAANMPITLMRRGVLDYSDMLGDLDYDAAVYLSDTEGAVADAAGTVSLVVGRVIPAHGTTTADKLLFVDL